MLVENVGTKLTLFRVNNYYSETTNQFVLDSNEHNDEIDRKRKKTKTKLSLVANQTISFLMLLLLLFTLFSMTLEPINQPTVTSKRYFHGIYYGGLQKCTGIGHGMQIMEADTMEVDALKEEVLSAKELCRCEADLYEKSWTSP